MAALRPALCTVMLSLGCAHQPALLQGKNVLSRYRGTPLALETGPDRYASHEVVPGETLWELAERYGTTVSALQRDNGVTDPAALRVGQRLLVPRGAGDKSGENGGRFSFAWPVEGTVTSPFGIRDGRPHDGIDIGAPKGAAVKAAADGEVVFSKTHGSYGNLVVLRHSGGMFTVYAHNSVNLVREGQRVNRGETIAKVGQTGRATGPHLHFEVRQGSNPEDPRGFLPP